MRNLGLQNPSRNQLVNEFPDSICFGFLFPFVFNDVVLGNGPKPFALKSNHQLFDDDYEESVPSPIGFKDMETEAELLIDIDSTPSNNLLKEANVIHHAERPLSRTSTSSRGVEDKFAAKRLLPIAQPMQLFYPEQEGLEGQTKELEVVYAENPSSFFCQLAEKIDPLNELMTKLSVTYAGILELN